MLKVTDLKKVYPKSDRVAVDGISFELRPGEIFGFLGQNGAGKSTTIKCLTGILPFDGGSIVTREQLSVFLYRYSQYAGDELANGVLDLYNDVDSVQSWALDGMAHAVGAGLITGTDEGNLEPAGPATRAQLAVILQRLMIPAVG